MSQLTFCIIQAASAAYEEMVGLRMRVLLQPIGIPRTYIDPQKEASELLLGVYESSRLVGCCILTPLDNQTVQLRQMAVDSPQQKTGVGRQLLYFAESIARSNGYQIVLMHARDAVLPFYQKCGYHIASDQFHEVGIPHHKMQKTITEMQ